jgi:glycerate kinase
VTADAGAVVVAPDKFKGSLTAEQAAAALARGLAAARPEVPVRQVPVADGGDGTVLAALAAGFEPVEAEATGPTGGRITARFAVRDDLAVVEAAAACGLVLLNGHTEPMATTSAGVGDLLLAAAEYGCRRVVLGVGGSACTDGGAGMLRALGARLWTPMGSPEPGGGGLSELTGVDMSTVDPRVRALDLVLASDVDNPLLGEHGAAAVFGPQKGASAAQVRELERGLANWAALVERDLGERFRDRPGAGAAGGIGFAALAVLGATRRDGIDLVLELTGFADAAHGARLVITGEGSLDEQSLRGKAPIGVVCAARRLGVPAVAVAGVCSLDADRLREAGIAAAYPLTDLEPDPARCITEAEALLERLAARIAEEWLT